MPPSAAALFQWLVKLPPRAFAQGELAWTPVLPVALLALLAVGGAGLVAWSYARVTALPVRDRALLAVLRTAALLLVVALLLRPAIVVASAVPQTNVLAVVVDDSRSMRLPAAGPGAEAAGGARAGATRLAAARAALADTGALMRALAARFTVRRFAGAATAAAIPSLDALRAAGTRTDLAQWLRDVPEAVQGAPLAGVVLVSDGGDNAGGALDEALEALRARRVPVHVVDLSAPPAGPDAAVLAVRLPAQPLAGGTVLAEATVRVRGASPAAVPVVAEVDGRVVTADSARPRGGQGVATARLRLPPMAAGVHRVAVRVPPLGREAVTQDNRWDGTVAVRAGPDRILVLEGEPRPEFAFLRRAILPDSALALTAVLRTAKGKFLRLGVRDSLELLGGFPATRAELFAYRAVVLGSLEAAALTGEQLRWLAEFVSVRGGGLLVLGGRASLSEGGYAGTALEAVLPLQLVPDSVNATGPARPLRLRPTAEGGEHPALQLAPGAPGSAAAQRWWEARPVVTTVNRPLVARRGAAVLLVGRDSAGGGEHPVLAWQRYGRGTAAVLAVQDLWLWRMDASVDEADLTLPLLWRQLLRWLAEEAPGPVQLAAHPAHGAPGAPVTVRAAVRTAEFADVADATVTAVVRQAGAADRRVGLEPQVGTPGDYLARLALADTGRATLRVTAVRGRDTLGVADVEVVVDTLGADQPADDDGGARLRGVARATGGRAYTLATVEALPSDAAITRAGITVKEAHDVWDMPLLFLLLLALLGAEWGVRRWRGLA